jgi:hypothetical protein
MHQVSRLQLNAVVMQLCPRACCVFSIAVMLDAVCCCTPLSMCCCELTKLCAVLPSRVRTVHPFKCPLKRCALCCSCCPPGALLLLLPGSAFYCWTTALPHNLDVWTFWSRIQDHSAAFAPAAAAAADSSSPAGVFPLLFLKGSVATLIAVGRDREHVAHLRCVIQHASSS